ncbi:SDR family oxidoreductase [Phenylobacterium sp.]|uniref:SDR family oxidoreductase n=1 Tax=Phenylobacterium sp. TaxID=1871053 RepID=UPI0025D4340E|nr:SDR family NAD(P)-dependent oxidoreductase [Phenylobacterium sp.]MBX3482037.1 SDR family NAD(P)-dependent oxidoreductase [Phenylobacterium sp.]MCW5758501.1 SDR family NAD(P)-dependent oxidoreductase [Phenylobacterium sp.]
MKVAGKVVVVTGGAEGIGAALCHRFRREGAAFIAVADRNAEGAGRVAGAVGGVAYPVDVADRAAVEALVADVEARNGRIDLFCSNAGVGDADPDPAWAASATDAAWDRLWRINVMAHVHAARAVLPGMVARGEGYLLQTISAAGLLSQVGGTVYSTTKHAAVGLAEAIAITHGDQGVRVSILCPQGVDTAMLRNSRQGANRPDGVLSPEAVADSVIAGLEAERFLILPHPQVAGYMQRKAADYDRWLAGMRRLRARTLPLNP